MQNKKDDLRLRELAIPLLGKWSPFILILLAERPHHFADLERKMETISRKVLTENLNNLLASGIIIKAGESSTGFPVFYSLSELGKSSLFILDTIKNWLKANEHQIMENRNQFYGKKK